jgi:hypothetical protein
MEALHNIEQLKKKLIRRADFDLEIMIKALDISRHGHF